MSRVILLVHGGAGPVTRESLPPERERLARHALHDALESGYALLHEGRSAVDAVERAVCVLEDADAFNAGRGSVLATDGTVEMDAAIMDGRALDAGGVCVVRAIRNPVRAARAVMEHTPHVLLAGAGAEALARERHLPFEPAEYFVTPFRREQLERARAADRTALDHETVERGTVGAVALDAAGHLAAATSTGGVANKLPGRVSDSSLPGAGTWADDRTCAVSATGTGDAFIRAAFAHRVAALVEYAGLSVDDACARALDAVAALGGRGGCVAVGAHGEVALPFTTPGMFRGIMDAPGAARLALFGDEPMTGFVEGNP